MDDKEFDDIMALVQELHKSGLPYQTILDEIQQRVYRVMYDPDADAYGRE